VAAIAWYAFRPELLFINKSVSENFPATSVAANSPDASTPKQLASGQFKGYAHETQGNMGDQNYDVPATADLAKYQAVTIWCARFNVNFGTAPLKGMMPSGPKQLAVGQFKGYAHETEGTAGIYDVDGKRVLRLTNFKTSNGPDVHVYLVALQMPKMMPR